MFINNDKHEYTKHCVCDVCSSIMMETFDYDYDDNVDATHCDVCALYAECMRVACEHDYETCMCTHCTCVMRMIDDYDMTCVDARTIMNALHNNDAN